MLAFLYPGPEPAAKPRIAAFISGLEEVGLRVPDQVSLVPRVTGGDPNKLSPMAAELASQKVDLIMAVSPAAIRAAMTATKAIPIVCNDLESDPVAEGFITSIAHPRGNVTGVFMDFPDFSKKMVGSLEGGASQSHEDCRFLGSSDRKVPTERNPSSRRDFPRAD